MSDEPPRYLVFSVEHQRWWRPGACGYTAKLSEAGRYTRESALRICASAIPGAAHINALCEVPVLETDAVDFHQMHIAQYGTIWEFLA